MKQNLKNVLNKTRTTETLNSYKKHQNFSANLLRETKKMNFENIIVKDVNDNVKFWF